MKLLKNFFLFALMSSPFSFLASSANSKGIDEKIDDAFMPIAEAWEGLVLTKIGIGTYDIPLVVLLLVIGASFFTIYFSFPSITRFWLAISTVRGKYDELEGSETTSYQADDVLKEESENLKVTESSVRRLSLFDTLDNQEKIEVPENSIKTEPKIEENINNSIEIDDKNQDFNEKKEFSPEESAVEEEFNQDPEEEELLDIPTFLRRQAN